MALIKCSECNKEISDKAELCVHCGNPLKKTSVDAESKNSDQRGSVLFEEGDILIKNDIIEIGTKKYNPKKLESIELIVDENIQYKLRPKNVKGLTFMCYILVALLVPCILIAIFSSDSGANTVFGLFSFVCFIVLMIVRAHIKSLKKKVIPKNIYTIVFSMASGKENAFYTYDEEIARKTTSAIENLITAHI